MNGSSNLDLYLLKYHKYVFNIDTVGYPFAIKHTLSLGSGDLWVDGLSTNVVDHGTIEFIVPPSAPAKLYYVNVNDLDMYGNIFIS